MSSHPFARRRLLQALSLAPLAQLPVARAAEGWRMPDEAEPHAATWMSFGPSEGVWGRRLLRPVREHLAGIARTIAAFEPVRMLVREEDYELATPPVRQPGQARGAGGG